MSSDRFRFHCLSFYFIHYFRRKTNFIRLDIKDCDNLKRYEIGDSLAVFPKNPSKLVSKVLKRCRTTFDLDEPIKLEINAYHNEGI